MAWSQRLAARARRFFCISHPKVRCVAPICLQQFTSLARFFSGKPPPGSKSKPASRYKTPTAVDLINSKKYNLHKSWEVRTLQLSLRVMQPFKNIQNILMLSQGRHMGLGHALQCPVNKAKFSRAIGSRQQIHISRNALQERLVDEAVLSTEFSGSTSDDEGSWSFSEEGVMAFNAKSRAPRVEAPAGARPILILPGFGNNSSDYEAPFGKVEGSLASNLRSRGFTVHVLPVERKDWFKVARAIFTFKFWSSSLTTHPGYTWYIDRIAEAVKQIQESTGCEQVDLVGHSAGGWLARAYLGDSKYQPGSTGQQPPVDQQASSKPHPAVRAVVTLGTPQRPPPAEKARDMTGGAQGWVHNSFPGAFFQGQGVRYICAGGVAVKGRRDFGPDGKVIAAKDRPRLPREYAYDAYYQVCGDGQEIEGDAVVPLASAFLSGARHVLLPGVWHSMSKIGTFDEESGLVWYGSEAVIDSWLGAYVEEAYDAKDN